MDPLTHGMIGLALSTFSGNPVALSNPLSIGCALGAMAPDTDSIVRLFYDDSVYLKQHRGFSHSLPALVVFSIVIASGLRFMFVDHSITQIFFWTFIGSLSHTVFDMLNSYGAMLLKKKKKFNLLTLYDPVIAILGITLIFQRQVNWYLNTIALMAFLSYIGLRYLFRHHACKVLERVYQDLDSVLSVAVLPSLLFFYKWDYIVQGSQYTYVGRYNGLTKGHTLIERLDAQCEHMRDLFDKTQLGEYFNDFSPHLHVVHHHHEEFITLRIMDLRYHVRNRFLHQATLKFDKKSQKVAHSILHPYSEKRSVVFKEAS